MLVYTISYCARTNCIALNASCCPKSIVGLAIIEKVIHYERRKKVGDAHQTIKQGAAPGSHCIILAAIAIDWGDGCGGWVVRREMS